LTSYSPVNTGSKPDLDPLAETFLTTTPERGEDRFPIDLDWWAENHEDMVAAYTNWLSS
jgi:putative spermidine/putrescine transport system substrate-binding protein